jgi:hypothetical protein
MKTISALLLCFLFLTILVSSSPALCEWIPPLYNETVWMTFRNKTLLNPSPPLPTSINWYNQSDFNITTPSVGAGIIVGGVRNSLVANVFISENEISAKDEYFSAPSTSSATSPPPPKRPRPAPSSPTFIPAAFAPTRTISRSTCNISI